MVELKRRDRGSIKQFRKRVEQLSDDFRFLKRWAGKPASLGAVTPSSRALSQLMASQLDLDSDLPIIELGPGTGPVTAAMLARGIDPIRLYLIEYDAEFCKLLRKRHPGVTVLQGDAYAHADNLRELAITKTANVISSLPLLSRPRPDRSRVITEALASMQPGGTFIQFSYGPKAPWQPDPSSHVSLEKSKWVKLNLPPARVWTYSNSAA